VNMRILYFHQHFSTPGGSTGIRSYEMARRLVERGHRVIMVCGSYGDGETGLSEYFRHGKRRGIVDGIDVIEFDLAYSNKDNFVKRSITFFSFAIKSILIALFEPCDLVFATTTPLTAGIPGVVARWLRGKPFVFEVRDLWPKLPRAMGVITNPFVLGAMSLLEYIIYHSATRLIGLSPGIVKGISLRGIDLEKIAMIPNGCDIRIFATEKKPLRPVGIPASDFIALYAGSHGIANGLTNLLAAAVELKRRGRTDIKFILIGQGKEKETLISIARKECLDNVIFLDPVDKVQLSRIMAGADLGLQLLSNIPAFYYGTSPNKFFDYIAAGLPVLNNYPGWLADMIEEYACGFVVPPDDPVAFADALEDAVRKRLELPEFGRRAQSLARERFDRDILALQFAEWLEKAISK